MFGQICKHMSDSAKRKAKQRWTIEKPKLDNAGQLRVIFFLEPDDEEFKLTMKAARAKRRRTQAFALKKAARRKLNVPMPAATLCKIPIKSSGNVEERKTKRA